MKKLVILSLVATVAANAFSQQEIIGDANLVWSGNVGTKVNTGVGLAENASYSNVTNYSGFAYSNGGATAGSPITFLVADDLLTVSPNVGIESFQFTVSNLDTVAFTARPRVRFYADNGSGAPGTYLTGFSFNPINFGAGSVGIYNFGQVGAMFTTPADGKVWAAITFDNVGATATFSNLNNLGQGIFNPPTSGSSNDSFFKTTASGSFVSNNPAGSSLFFGGSPVANFGWSLTAVPEPTSMAVLGLGLLGLARRRRTSK